MKLTIKFEDIHRLDEVLDPLASTVSRFEITVNPNGDLDIVLEDDCNNIIGQFSSAIHRNSASNLLTRVGPPTLAKYILLLVPKKNREHLIGDLEEEFWTILAQYGVRKARFWYWWQTIFSIVAFCANALKITVFWKSIGR